MISRCNIQRSTARIDRAVSNSAIYGDAVRSVLATIITRTRTSIARSPRIATAERTCRIGALTVPSYASTVARSVRSVSCVLVSRSGPHRDR